MAPSSARDSTTTVENNLTGLFKRLGTPQDIASIVSSVASDESGFAIGADFSVNGGLHMG